MNKYEIKQYIEKRLKKLKKKYKKEEMYSFLSKRAALNASIEELELLLELLEEK